MDDSLKDPKIAGLPQYGGEQHARDSKNQQFFEFARPISVV